MIELLAASIFSALSACSVSLSILVGITLANPAWEREEDFQIVWQYLIAYAVNTWILWKVFFTCWRHGSAGSGSSGRSG